jgi:hypothetical protein
VKGLVGRSDLSSFGAASVKILDDLVAVAQAVGDHRVDVVERESRVLLNDLLGGGSQ